MHIGPKIVAVDLCSNIRHIVIFRALVSVEEVSILSQTAGRIARIIIDANTYQRDAHRQVDERQTESAQNNNIIYFGKKALTQAHFW